MGSSDHYDSLLKKRQAGKIVVRNRDDDSDSDTPFDDEIDRMTLDTFNARYLSQTSPIFT